MIKQIGILAVVVGCTAHQTFAQYYQKPESRVEYDQVSLGIGAGFDYGGIGASALAYPQKNVGLFVAGGYALAGFGYNVGAKARLAQKKKWDPFLTAMYGYNTAFVVTNAQQLNKIFYGVTFGGGIDLHPRSNRYFTFALLIPVRGPEVDNYMNQMKSMGISFNNSLPPVGISVGYRFLME